MLGAIFITFRCISCNARIERGRLDYNLTLKDRGMETDVNKDCNINEALSGSWANNRLAASCDAKQFILRHRLVIELAPLQTYTSALLFTPQASVIRNL